MSCLVDFSKSKMVQNRRTTLPALKMEKIQLVSVPFLLFFLICDLPSDSNIMCLLLTADFQSHQKALKILPVVTVYWTG